MIELLKENYEWIFSGLGVSLLLFFANIFFNKNNKSHEVLPTNKNLNTNSNTNSVIINNYEKNLKSSDSIVENRKKDNTRILFVDDEHTKFKIVSILKKAGWRNTKSIKDITDLDDIKANEADIIFVDINGVGTTLFEDQGLGLASALKKKYPMKTIVIYSDETTGDRFHKALREVDDCLPKNAEPYQFINLIENSTK